jgi:hypothetical protein
MGLTEAKKYIQHLHKKQDNPYLWPDYLTGLPDKSAIIKKMESVTSLSHKIWSRQTCRDYPVGCRNSSYNIKKMQG